MIRPALLPRATLRAMAVLTLAAIGPVTAGAQRTGEVKRPVGGAPTAAAETEISISVRQTGENEVTVSWTKVPGATRYFIGRNAPPNGWQRVDSPTPAATRYVDRNVQPGRTYRYGISAVLNDRAGRRFTSDSIVVQEGAVITAGGSGVADIEEEVETREAMLERVYRLGHSRNAWWQQGAGRARTFWLKAADVSRWEEAELTARWKEIAIAAQLYQHIFDRAPDGLELGRQLAAQRSGKSYDDMWRELAQSSKRDREHGSFAPSPMTMSQAAGLFGWRNHRPGEQCFGGLGPGCTGTIPPVFEWVQPRWKWHFQLPDGTEMAYVELGVAIGSILHDNACMDAPQGRGIACSGWVAINDITKHSGLPAAMEWNKAAWNVIDGRGWRHTFGPYPVDLSLRRRWYDDLRVVRPARRAMMANVLGTLTLPIHDQPYKGVERKASRVLGAPSRTTLDGGDGAYCASGRGFRNTESPIGKAPSGICW